MAELIRSELGIESELVVGRPGEFRVLVDGNSVVKKGFFSFPSPDKCLTAVKKAISA